MAADLPVRSTSRVRVLLRLSPLPLHHWYEPEAGCISSVVTVLSGRATISACLSAVLYSETPSLVTDFVADWTTL